jgi:hypothetical protein
MQAAMRGLQLSAISVRRLRLVPAQFKTWLVSLAGVAMLLSPDPALAAGHSMTISVSFPDGRRLEAELDQSEVSQLTGSNVNYMLVSWAQAAFSKLDLSYETTSERSAPGIAIVSIAGVANGEHGTWAYFANEIRSPYALNTQLFEGIERLEFRFEATPE